MCVDLAHINKHVAVFNGILVFYGMSAFLQYTGFTVLNISLILILVQTKYFVLI